MAQPAPLPLDWRATEYLPMAQAARILAVSRAQLYRLAQNGGLRLNRSIGRTVVPTAEVIRLVDAADRWCPSSRNHAAVAALKARRQGA
jgi:transposase-like protein